MIPRILLIYTGGTIGMVSDAATGALKPLNFREIESDIPALKRLGVEIEYYEGFPPIDSSDAGPDTWARLAEVIRDNYERFDGFVVLHGTDTMAYTASALSFMLENLAKPVVFTGSQIPIGVLRTDGRENLVTAVEIAAARKTEFSSERAVCKAREEAGRGVYLGVNNEPGDKLNEASGTLSRKSPQVPEVSIYFQNKLFRANRTTKWSAEQLNAFSSENYPPLAEVGVSINYNLAAGRRPDTDSVHPRGESLLPSNAPARSPKTCYATEITPAPLEISTSLCRDVTLIRIFPGIEPRIFESMLSVDGLRGAVLQTFGAGNTPTAPWFFEILERAISRGVVILNVTQCIAGSVKPIYESGIRLARAGVVSGRDMTLEAAITKLMYVLGKNLPLRETIAELNRPCRGDFSE